MARSFLSSTFALVTATVILVDAGANAGLCPTDAARYSSAAQAQTRS